MKKKQTLHINFVPCSPVPLESWSEDQIQDKAFLEKLKRRHTELAKVQVPDRQIIGISRTEE